MEGTIKKFITATMVLIFSFSLVAYTGNSNFTVSAASAKTISIKKKPTLKARKVKATTVKLKWSETKNATSYRIYRSTNQKKWRLVAKTKKTSYTVKNLKENKTYYFKVRAIKKTASGTEKSPYSEIVAVKTKKQETTTEKVKETTTKKKNKKTPTQTSGGIALKPIESATAKKIVETLDLSPSINAYEGKSADNKLTVVYIKDGSGWHGSDYSGTLYDANGNVLICQYCGLIASISGKKGYCDLTCGPVLKF